WKRSGLENWIMRASPALMKVVPFESLKKAGMPQISAKREVQEYTYDAYAMLSKEDYFRIMTGVFGCLHHEPGYRITRPMLLVHGDDDRMGDIRKIAPAWAAREANCEYAVIPNARHFAILDNPERFNQLLMEFLAKWARGTPAITCPDPGG